MEGKATQTGAPVDVSMEGKATQIGAPVDASTMGLVTKHSPSTSDAGTHYAKTQQEVTSGQVEVNKLIAAIEAQERASGETVGKSAREIFRKKQES